MHGRVCGLGAEGRARSARYSRVKLVLCATATCDRTTCVQMGRSHAKTARQTFTIRMATPLMTGQQAPPIYPASL